MVARSKKDIEKAHALNKKVRREKARLRKRGPKKAQSLLKDGEICFGEIKEWRSRKI